MDEISTRREDEIAVTHAINILPEEGNWNPLAVNNERRWAKRQTTQGKMMRTFLVNVCSFGMNIIDGTWMADLHELNKIRGGNRQSS